MSAHAGKCEDCNEMGVDLCASGDDRVCRHCNGTGVMGDPEAIAALTLLRDKGYTIDAILQAWVKT